MTSGVKNVLCLAIITCVAGFLLGYVYDVTKEPIAQMEEQSKLDAYKSIFDSASDFEDVETSPEALEEILLAANLSYVTCEDVVMAKDSAGKQLGYIFNVTSHEGYGGDIEMSVCIEPDGTVKGIEILSISETAGLGMNAQNPEFKSNFENKKVSKFSYVKGEASADFEVEAISGATITTNAVTNAVNGAISIFESIRG